MAFHHVFYEPRKGFVAHTAASRRLAEEPISMDALGYMFDEVWQSFAHTVPALEEWGDTGAPNETGWNNYHNTDKPTWEYYADHPEQARRFASAMAAFTNSIGNSPGFLSKGYPWDSIGNKGNGTVVDVGGSKGHICVTLAKEFPNLKFIVQDTPSVIEGAKETVPAEVRDRIDFSVHDFFTPQIVKADAYFFRYIFHNWSDAYSIKILRALIPALKPGAKIIINDHVLPEPGTMSLAKERAYRDMDMVMLTLFNSREREKDDWEKLFHDSDPRFGNIKVWNPEGATLGIIEATWEGGEDKQ